MIGGLDDLEGVVRATSPTTIMMLPASYVLQMIEHLRQADALTAAAIRLSWSEWGTAAMLSDEAHWQERFEEWPEMTGLVAAIDPLRPGWRAQGAPS